MGNTLAIARREFSSFFYSPVGYVVMCVFVLLAGMLFLRTTLSFPNQPANLRTVFVALLWVFIPVVPAISMRLIAEELRSGTVETLMSSPVSDVQVILGKWLGALGFLAALLAPTLLFVVILETWADPDYGPILLGYLGLVLVGGLYMAIGAFASVLTRNQIIAFLLTIFIVLLLTLGPALLRDSVPVEWVPVVDYFNINIQYEDFAKGLLDSRKIVYFLSGIALFLTLAVKAMESRKWR